jgi:hypothetical protein
VVHEHGREQREVEGKRTAKPRDDLHSSRP